MRKHLLLGVITTGSLLALVGPSAEAAPKNSTSTKRVATNKPQRTRLLAKNFGAIGNSATDARPAIQAAIDAARDAGGGEVIIPAGTYRVTLAPFEESETALRRVFTVYPNVVIRGESQGSTTIKLADGQGGYGAMFAGATFGADVSSFALRSLTVDQNTTQNPVTSEADVALDNTTFRNSKIRAAVWLANGNNITVDGVRFTDSVGVWTVFVGGNTERVSALTISNNTFDRVGGGAIDFDASTVYVETNGERSRIVNNSFVSRNGGAAGSLGLRSGIEVHGSNIDVTDNVVKGFLTGINVGGAWPTNNVKVHNNRFENANSGVVLWADAVRTEPVPEVAMRNIVVDNNAMSLDVGGWQGAQFGRDATYSGVRVEQQGANDRKLVDVRISRNSIRFLNAQRTDHQVGDRYSAGIHYNRGWFSSDTNLTTGLSINGNTIVDSPGMGIYVNAPITNGELRGNRIVNPGASAGAQQWLGWRSAIFLQNLLTDFRVSGNTFSGDAMAQGIFAINDVGGENTAEGNRVEGSAVPVFVRAGGSGSWASATD